MKTNKDRLYRLFGVMVVIIICLATNTSCAPLISAIFGSKQLTLINDAPYCFVIGDTYTLSGGQDACDFDIDPRTSNALNSGDTLLYHHSYGDYGLDKRLQPRDNGKTVPVLELVVAYPEIDGTITKPNDGCYVNPYIYSIMYFTSADLEPTDYIVHIQQLSESFVIVNETPYELTIGYLIEDENNRQIVCFNPSSCSVPSQGRFSYVPRERYPVSSLRYLSSSCQDSARFVAIYSSCYPEQKPSVLLYDDLVKDKSLYWENSVSIDSISDENATIVIGTVGE